MSKVKKDGEDICYLCEDCDKYGLCEYYHDRKPTSYICKFFKVKEDGGYGFEERKTGKWVLVHPLQEDDGGAYECSCCKSGSWEVDPATWKACPWCMALMEGEDES